MSATEVELFRSDDYMPDERIALMPLLREFFEPLVGQSLERSQFILYFLPVADRPELAGSPSMVNLRASHGWLQVQIVRDGQTLYRHPHAVREIIAGPLQQRVAGKYPDEKHWGYCVRAPGMDGIALVRPAPQAVNQVDIAVGARRRPRRFNVEEIPEPVTPPGHDTTKRPEGVSDRRGLRGTMQAQPRSELDLHTSGRKVPMGGRRGGLSDYELCRTGGASCGP